MEADSTLVTGVPSHLCQPFIERDPRLKLAKEQAEEKIKALEEEFGAEFLAGTEKELAINLQKGLSNFYHQDVVNRYVPVSAQGPWIVTLHGSVLYDVGGYGMLGFGHNHSALLHAMSTQQCMANIMTPSFSQKRFFYFLFFLFSFTY
jgi:4-aminobutyrate aminotransferase-like enzyme